MAVVSTSVLKRLTPIYKYSFVIGHHKPSCQTTPLQDNLFQSIKIPSEGTWGKLHAE